MPRCLPKLVKSSLNKALESAMLAVEMYNKPAAKFKSGGYIVMMCIAWTSLFHAIFLRKKIKPIYKEQGGTHYVRVDGEYKFWELKKCVKEYFLEENNPMRKNLELFIPLRNKLEHKFMPELDATIFAECQAMLLNFDKVVEKEFGCNYCLRESLSFSLQLFPSAQNLQMAVRDNSESKLILDFIEKYRSAITTEVLRSGEYAFKAFLIQVANHDAKDTLAIQFYPYDKLTEQEKRNVDRAVTLIKEKHIMHSVSNTDKMKPGTVVEKVQAALGNPKITRGNKRVDKFNTDTHTRCWKKYKVRPEGGSTHPEHTIAEYCTYDSMNKNYGYTQAWVDFLIEKMNDENEYNSLYLAAE